MPRPLIRGVAWLIAAELGYAVMRTATRAGASDVPWAENAAIRFLGGALVAVVAARVQGQSLRVADQRNAWLRSLFGTGGALCLFHALGSHGLPVGDATTLYSTTPLWVALLSWPLLGERVPRVVWVGIGVGLLGVATLLGAELRFTNATALWVLLGAVSYALAILRLRRLSRAESSAAIALHMSLVAGGVLLLVALPHWRPVPRSAWLPLALSALGGGLGQVAVGRAYAHAPAARLAALTYVGLVFTYGFEALLFHTAPTLQQLAGAALVVAGGVMVSGIVRFGAPTSAE